jgi:hypothetical protein
MFLSLTTNPLAIMDLFLVLEWGIKMNLKALFEEKQKVYCSPHEIRRPTHSVLAKIQKALAERIFFGKKHPTELASDPKTPFRTQTTSNLVPLNASYLMGGSIVPHPEIFNLKIDFFLINAY